MPGLPYSQDNSKFRVDPDTGNIHSEMNTPGVRMAYAARLFLQMVHETGHIGRVATKPTQAKEDAVNAGRLKRGDLVLLTSVGAGFTVGSVLVRWAY